MDNKAKIRKEDALWVQSRIDGTYDLIQYANGFRIANLSSERFERDFKPIMEGAWIDQNLAEELLEVHELRYKMKSQKTS